MDNKNLTVIIGSCILLLLFLAGCAKNVLEINLKEHKDLALHIHTPLEIEILGKKQLIPEKIGISNEGMMVIHTHDASGRLHIESPYAHQFYLKDFFTIWGRTYNERCIFQHCVDDTHTLKVYVNGKESKWNPPLYDKEDIKVVYAEIE